MRVSEEPVCIHLFRQNRFCLPAFEISRSCRTASEKEEKIDQSLCKKDLRHLSVNFVYILVFQRKMCGKHCCQMAEFWAAGLKNGPEKLLAA
jgi:hypothetical protein